LANIRVGQIRGGKRANTIPGASGPGDRELGRCSVKSVLTTAPLTFPHLGATTIDTEHSDGHLELEWPLEIIQSSRHVSDVEEYPGLDPDILIPSSAFFLLPHEVSPSFASREVFSQKLNTQQEC
jgi:hypothetical protein